MLVQSGPRAGETHVLEEQRVLTFGRGEDSDFSIPDDAEFSEKHFSLEIDSRGCRLRDLDSATGTLLNGQLVVDGVVHDRDRVGAGLSTFVFEFLKDSTHDDTVAEPDDELTAKQLCDGLDLGDDATALLDEKLKPIEYINILEQNAIFDDALRVMARLLAKPQAVYWSVLCIRGVSESTSPMNNSLLAAEQWAINPSEENRRGAEAAANEANFEGAAAVAALSAFWSDGSLTPPELDPAPPDPWLTSQGVSGAVLIASGDVRPEQMEEVQRCFLQIGRALQSGDVVIPPAVDT